MLESFEARQIQHSSLPDTMRLIMLTIVADRGKRTGRIMLNASQHTSSRFEDSAEKDSSTELHRFDQGMHRQVKRQDSKLGQSKLKQRR